MKGKTGTWTSGQQSELLRQAEAGWLSGAQLDAAARFAPLHPSARQWRHFIEQLLALGGVLLLGAGVVFFFASNWNELHRLSKFGLAIAALLAVVGVAVCSVPGSTRWRSALLAASIATGALLALIGQIYQAGADPWQLFALWAALMLPFVLLARARTSWLLWLVVANVAVVLAQAPAFGWGWIDPLLEPQALYAMSTFSLLMLGLFECCGRWLVTRRDRLLPRLASAGVILPLTWAASLGWLFPPFRPALSFFFLMLGLGAAVYGAWRQDVAILALLIYAAIGVLAAGLFSWTEPHLMTLLGLALFIALSSAAAGWWLLRLLNRSRKTEQKR